MQRKTNTFLAVLGLVMVCILMSYCTNHSSVFAYSLTVTTSGSITTDITPASDDGVGTTIVTDEVGITSNCRSGYTFTITGSSDNNLYLNGDDTNNTVGTYFAPVNGTDALNDTNNINKWGYSATANTESGIFTPLTDTSVTIKTPSQTSSPDSDIDTTLPIYYGTAVDNTITPGAYTFSSGNSIIYVVTMEPTCLTYTVQYQDGGADNPNGMGTTNASTGEKSVRQTNLSEGTTITLLAPNYKKSGYGFLGWSTDSDAYAHFTDNDNTNNPIIYGPMETVTITADMIALATDRNQINMYPVWVPALKDGSNNTVYFQDWDDPNTALPHDGCNTLTQTVFDNNQTNEKDKIIATKNSIVALTDKRDNEVYTVAKLADGKCWMIENLRLNNQYTMGQNQNDPTVTNQSLAQGYGGTTGTYGNFVGLAESENANFGSVSTLNSVYKGVANLPVDAYDPINHTLEDIGTTNNSTHRFPRYNNDNTQNLVDSTVYTQDYTNSDTTTETGTNYRTSSNLFSYGNYYSWPAAIANTNHYANSSISDSSSTSVCPSGWTLPTTGNATKDFGLFMRGYGGTGDNQTGATESGDIMSRLLRSFPNNYIYSGHIIGSAKYYLGDGGNYWSRSVYSNYATYDLSISNYNVYPSNSNGVKNYGFTVRCETDSLKVEIALNSNNGASAISRLYATPGSTITLPQNSIAELGYGFKNWNTAPDGSGTTYTTSYNIPSDSTGVTLYAQWNPQYTIIYKNNCITYTSCSQSSSDRVGVQRINLDSSGNGSVTLGAYNYSSWTISGWKIQKWTTNPDGTGDAYLVNSTFSVVGKNAGDTITLYAYWTPVYTIQYDGNGADNSDGMGVADENGIKSVKQVNISENDAVVLLAPNYRRVGYSFVGWSTSSTAIVGGSDRIFGPNETISAPAYPSNENKTVTMYAVWLEAEKDVNDNPVYLQDWNGCSDLASASYDSITGEVVPGGIIALTDKRDNEVYAIAKLADNNCWMIENLRLESAGTLGNNINDNSVTNESLSQGYGGVTGTYGNFVGLPNSESSNYGGNTSNGIYKTSDNPPVDVYDPLTGSLEDVGTTNYPSHRIPRYNHDNVDNMISSPTFQENYANAPNSSTTGNYKTSTVVSYGNYYSWAAVMANTRYFGFDVSLSENVRTSICPRGWHLPSGGSSTKEYGVLSQRYGGNGDNQEGINNNGNTMSMRLRTFPNNFIYSGLYNSSSAQYRGSSGIYWSRTTQGWNNSYGFSLGASFLRTAYVYYKYGGLSVRCVVGDS